MAKAKPDWKKGLSKKQVSDAKKRGRRWLKQSSGKSHHADERGRKGK